METWGARLYGDPCASCGWRWSLAPLACVEQVRGAPARFADLLDGCTGTERHPDLSWSVTGYVAHVADDLRLWSERLARVMRGADLHVTGHDPDALAAARRYEELSPPGALWSLEQSAKAWADVLTQALEADVVVVHATRGTQRAEDVARNNAHDAHHHAWDVPLSL